MKTRDECAAIFGEAASENEFCVNFQNEDGTLNPNSDNVVLRPCCGVRMSSRCQLLTEPHCIYMGGAWQQTAQLCSQVSCLPELCQFHEKVTVLNDFAIKEGQFPNAPAAPNQWVRWFLPLFGFAGVIQLFCCTCAQYWAGCKVEKQAGWLRTALIYFISGLGGYAFAGIMSPYTLKMGPDPAIFGLLGVLFVDLFQAWPIIKKPWNEFFKLFMLTLVALLLGTLPFIDNWSHVGGFIFGILSGSAFLPYITFGKWDVRRKQLLVFISLFLLIISGVICYTVFYTAQNNDFCPSCKYLNCVPYTDGFHCDDSWDTEF